MSEYREYQRIVLDVEVEITDSVHGRYEGETPESHVLRVTQKMIRDAFGQNGAEAGVRLVSSETLARQAAHSGFYEEMTLPERIGRLDDGTEVLPPSMEGTDADV